MQQGFKFLVVDSELCGVAVHCVRCRCQPPVQRHTVSSDPQGQHGSPSCPRADG
jgi:hypothetical protein